VFLFHVVAFPDIALSIVLFVVGFIALDELPLWHFCREEVLFLELEHSKSVVTGKDFLHGLVSAFAGTTLNCFHDSGPSLDP
jgi:hypothetical protein